MNKSSTQIVKTPFPKLVSDFARENFNLKILAMFLLVVNLTALTVILILVKRGARVIALESGGGIATLETKVTDLQIEAASREYLKYRYSWTPATIAESLKKAEFFVLPQLTKSFERSMIEIKKFVLEKKVVQRVYPKSISVDLNQKKITILADRFTEFDQLKAATEMRLTLDFIINDRTAVNPWGLFIVKEFEEGGR